MAELQSSEAALALRLTEAPAPAAEAPSPRKNSYGQILKSSALIGGSSAFNILISIVRTKAMALILGPAGFGLMGAFSAVADVARSLAAMGISNSGVRQIAESVGGGDLQRIARTVTVLRRTTLVLGVLGAALLAVFSRQVAVLTFGDAQHAAAVALLSLAVFFRLVAEGQGALIQGMRRIADFAKINVIGGLLGTIASIPLVYWLREEGVALSLVAVAAMSAAASWWYSRKVRVERPAMTAAQFRNEASSLLKLGFAFMVSGFLMMGAAYVTRIILIRFEGLEAAGLFQAAWTLGGLYVGFVLQAMGADFYPRLVGVCRDNPECNRLVNEQTQMSLLLASCGVIATLTLAPLVLMILYSASFTAASESLRWICLGMALRVVTWPMGYIIVAKGEQALFILAELAWTVFNVSATWFFVKHFGLNGAGIAFFASYVFHAALIYPMVRQLSGFRWSPTSLRMILLFNAIIGAVFVAFLLLPAGWATAVGVAAFVLGGLHSLRVLVTLVSPERAPRWLQEAFRRLGATGQKAA
jgi:PST family polysaccharide transporter